MSFHHHKCSLDQESDCMLSKNKGLNCCRSLKKWCMVSEYHPETSRYFCSYTAVVAERHRHLSEGDSCVAHPFSMFRFMRQFFDTFSLCWNTFTALVDLLHICTSSSRLTFVLNSMDNHHVTDYFMLMLQFLCLVNVAIKFHTGYVEKDANVVLDRTAIAWRYVRFWFFIDLATCFPVSFLLIAIHADSVYIYLGHILLICRTVRIILIIKNVNTFLKMFGGTYHWNGSIINLIIFALSLHLCSCIIYLSPVTFYYWNGYWSKNYNTILELRSENLNHYSVGTRYRKAMCLSLSSFLGTAFSLFNRFQPEEVLAHSLVIMYSSIFMLYCLVFYIKVYLTKYNSLIRYHELMDQVKEYMSHRQFPIQLKKRVIAFYRYKYWDTYFREELVFGTLSEQIGDEIILYTRYKLVNKVTLLEGLPAGVVGALLGCLRPEVYLPNDLVVRAGDLGDCMYFIDSGTVSVYSHKGVEVCHLEDGAHFGEIALLMKDNKRVATVIAIEITVLYRLDAHDFRRFVTTYHTLYERIDSIASRRMNETVMLDEALRWSKEFKRAASTVGN